LESGFKTNFNQENIPLGNSPFRVIAIQRRMNAAFVCEIATTHSKKPKLNDGLSLLISPDVKKVA